MKSKVFSVLLIAAALSLTGCKDDALIGGDDNLPNSTESSGKKLYINAAVALPSTAGSRSSTDDSVTGSGNDQTNSNLDKDKDINGGTQTPQEDFEYGYDYENDVRTMILVFAAPVENESDKFLCYSVVSGLEKAPTGSKYDFNVLAEIKYEDLKDAYDGVLEDNYEVNVYAYCNYTANIENIFKNTSVGDQDWIDQYGTVTEGGSSAGESPSISNTIWANRSFLMTNYENVSTVFPESIDDWNDYADKNTPFLVTKTGDQEDETINGNPIKVERAAARIDFRNASGNDDNIYKILTDVHKLTDSDSSGKEDEKNLYSIQLTRMALVNMSKKFYYLRRVSDDGLNANAEIGGFENSKNYVVDVDADDKVKGSVENSRVIKSSNADKYFNFPLYDSEGNYNKENWYVDNIKDVLKGKDDTWSGSTSPYSIWRYVTENTIPGVDNQITVQSTGVVFKGRILLGDEGSDTYDTDDDLASDEPYVSEEVQEALGKVSSDNELSDEEGQKLPILYSFDGFLYAGWEELIKKAANDGIGGRLYTAVEKILENWKLDGTAYKYEGSGEESLNVAKAYDIITKVDQTNTIEITDEQVRSLAPDQNITVYVASNEKDGEGWGYYCYYFYWNRHNDNLKSGLMGPMEFATVRNNVYKLSVSKIEKFGHPSNKDDDPDPVDEGDPDEEPTRYIQVQVEVLPWVVRVNDITF